MFCRMCDRNRKKEHTSINRATFYSFCCSHDIFSYLDTPLMEMTGGDVNFPMNRLLMAFTPASAVSLSLSFCFYSCVSFEFFFMDRNGRCQCCEPQLCFHFTRGVLSAESIPSVMCVFSLYPQPSRLRHRGALVRACRSPMLKRYVHMLSSMSVCLQMDCLDNTKRDEHLLRYIHSIWNNDGLI